MIELGGLVTSGPRPVVAAGHAVAGGDVFGDELRRALEARPDTGREGPGKASERTSRTTADEAARETVRKADEARPADKADKTDKEAVAVASEGDAGAGEEVAAWTQAAQLAAADAEELVGEEPLTEETADFEEALEGLMERQTAVFEPTEAEGDEAEGQAAEEWVDSAAVDAALPEVPVEDGPTALDLLTPDELAAPDIRFDAAPERLIERLQQAVGSSAGAAAMEEAAEVVLPQVVRGMASLVRDGMAEMRLQLQPADLGEIELRVKAAEGAVRGEMLVQHPEVKQLLESQLERLRAALGDSGLQLEGFDVDVSGGDRGRQTEEEQAVAGGGRQGAESENEGQAAAPGLRPGPVAGSDAVVDYVV